MLMHLIILPTLLTGLRGRTLGALGRMCFVRAGACDTLKRGVRAWSTLRVACVGGTGVVPSGVSASTPAAAGCVGAASSVMAVLVAAVALGVAVEAEVVFNLDCC